MSEQGRAAGLLVGGLLAVLLTAACGPGADPPQGASAAVEGYFTALGEGRYRVMLGLSTGPARLYAEYLVAGDRSVNGPAAPPGLEELELGGAEAETDAEGDRLRITGHVSAGPSGRTTFRDFRLVRDGDRWLLDDYLRDGRPLAHFVSATDAKAFGDGLRVTADLAFRDPSAGTLGVPVVITNDRSVDIDLRSYEARFIATGSDRAHRIDFAGPGPLAAGDSIDLILIFDSVDNADAGGRILVTFREPDGDNGLMQPLVVSPFAPE